MEVVDLSCVTTVNGQGKRKIRVNFQKIVINNVDGDNNGKKCDLWTGILCLHVVIDRHLVSMSTEIVLVFHSCGTQRSMCCTHSAKSQMLFGWCCSFIRLFFILYTCFYDSFENSKPQRVWENKRKTKTNFTIQNWAKKREEFKRNQSEYDTRIAHTDTLCGNGRWNERSSKQNCVYGCGDESHRQSMD